MVPLIHLFTSSPIGLTFHPGGASVTPVMKKPLTTSEIVRPGGELPSGFFMTPLGRTPFKEGSVVKKALVGLALAFTLSACGGIQKAADAVDNPTSAAQPTVQPDSRASFVRAYVNEETSLNWDNVPDSLIDDAGFEACAFAGTDLDAQELAVLTSTTMTELGVSQDDAFDVEAALITVYCPNTTIGGESF